MCNITLFKEAGDICNLGGVWTVDNNELWVFDRKRVDKDVDAVPGSQLYIYIYQGLWYNLGKSCGKVTGVCMMTTLPNI